MKNIKNPFLFVLFALTIVTSTNTFAKGIIGGQLSNNHSVSNKTFFIHKTKSSDKKWKNCIDICTDNYVDCQLSETDSLKLSFCDNRFDRCVLKCDYIYPENIQPTRESIVDKLKFEMKLN